jgi:hypothetical protein
MKTLKAILCLIMVSLLLASVSCRDTSGQKSGTKTGQDANGDTRGTEKPADNQDSGSSPRATPSNGANDQ